MSTPAVSPAEQYARFRERQAAPEFTSFRELYDFEFDPFQVAACGALTAGDGVLVAAPTGSGKTVVGEYADLADDQLAPLGDQEPVAPREPVDQ